MQEAKNKAIEIKAVDGDIDDETILRFVQYVYTGDYTTPPTGRDGKHYRNEAQAEDVGKDPPKKRQKKTDSDKVLPPKYLHCHKSDRAWLDFCSGVQRLPQIRWDSDDNAHALDYTENLLSHARLYIFSNRYSCDELKSLCVKKLHMTLVHYNEYSPKRMQGVVQLVQYVFEHTQEFTTGVDSLREMVTKYAVCKIDDLLKDKRFHEILVDQSSLAKILIIRLAQILSQECYMCV